MYLKQKSQRISAGRCKKMYNYENKINWKNLVRGIDVPVEVAPVVTSNSARKKMVPLDVVGMSKRSLEI